MTLEWGHINVAEHKRHAGTRIERVKDKGTVIDRQWMDIGIVCILSVATETSKTFVTKMRFNHSLTARHQTRHRSMQTLGADADAVDARQEQHTRSILASTSMQ